VSSVEVVGLGALNIDRIYRVERILDDGEALVTEAESFPGGSAANTIYGLARLGLATGFIGMVGDDADGETLIKDFGTVGVDTSRIRVSDRALTGSVLCLSDRQGKRSLYVTPGANSLLAMDDLDLDYLNRASLLHLSSFASDKQLAMSLDLMAFLGLQTKLSFAPGALYAVKGLKTLSPIVSRTHVLFVNQDELRQLTGKDIIAGAESCLERGCKVVAVTLGKGVVLEVGGRSNRRRVTAASYIRDAEAEYVVPASEQAKISQADTTGAGDAFSTGFLYGLLKGKGLDECGRLGSIVAQFSLTQTGARQGLPTRQQLTRRYQELYSVAP
jgi:ribokinase